MQGKDKPEPFAIDGLPGAQCRTYSDSTFSETRRATCSIAVGRYTSVFTDVQVEKVRQVTSAAYLILRGAA
ncbi:hypothetical protein [Tsukamurella sp. PLM1]|uniref:DUF7373 family lipoprotein n=1 Tax=Tsukamurella sp. PLM1 TaxID=2929795 RepID=UPI0020BEACD3|nr:hypothetical protein [Tsukamurella sp. PLM1]